jgi:hypothetical protein
MRDLKLREAEMFVQDDSGMWEIKIWAQVSFDTSKFGLFKQCIDCLS